MMQYINLKNQMDVTFVRCFNKIIGLKSYSAERKTSSYGNKILRRSILRV